MHTDTLQLVGTMLLCAELLLILTRSSEIQTLMKPSNRRSQKEDAQIKRGLARSLALEALVFVPASVVLVAITVKPLLLLSEPLRIKTATDSSLAFAFHGTLGITSYGFPFGALRSVVRRIALNTLREFATIAHSSDDPDPATASSQQVAPLR